MNLRYWRNRLPFEWRWNWSRVRLAWKLNSIGLSPWRAWRLSADPWLVNDVCRRVKIIVGQRKI
jgi:hypothetical protein